MAVQDSESDLRKLMTDGGWQFPVALMPDSVPAAYGIRAVPTLVLLDSGGRIAKTWVGAVSAAKLSAALDDLTG
jgi:hypothetical protein